MRVGMSNEYRKHLASIEWQRRRARALLRAGFRCEFVVDDARCPNRGCMCHHWGYSSLGAETDADLVVLCEQHHAVLEDEKRAARREKAKNTYLCKVYGDDWRDEFSDQEAEALFSEWFARKQSA